MHILSYNLACSLSTDLRANWPSHRNRFRWSFQTETEEMFSDTPKTLGRVSGWSINETLLMRFYLCEHLRASPSHSDSDSPPSFASRQFHFSFFWFHFSRTVMSVEHQSLSSLPVYTTHKLWRTRQHCRESFISSTLHYNHPTLRSAASSSSMTWAAPSIPTLITNCRKRFWRCWRWVMMIIVLSSASLDTILSVATRQLSINHTTKISHATTLLPCNENFWDFDIHLVGLCVYASVCVYVCVCLYVCRSKKTYMRVETDKFERVFNWKSSLSNPPWRHHQMLAWRPTMTRNLLALKLNSKSFNRIASHTTSHSVFFCCWPNRKKWKKNELRFAGGMKIVVWVVTRET